MSALPRSTMMRMLAYVASLTSADCSLCLSALPHFPALACAVLLKRASALRDAHDAHISAECCPPAPRSMRWLRLARCRSPRCTRCVKMILCWVVGSTSWTLCAAGTVHSASLLSSAVYTASALDGARKTALPCASACFFRGTNPQPITTTVHLCYIRSSTFAAC